MMGPQEMVCDLSDLDNQAKVLVGGGIGDSPLRSGQGIACAWGESSDGPRFTAGCWILEQIVNMRSGL